MTPPPPRRDASSSPPSDSSGKHAAPSEGSSRDAGSGRRPSPAVVACGLLALVLLLSLAAFVGVRAWIGGDEDGEQGAAPQHAMVVTPERSDAA